jgi:leucyl aminopeptidase
MKSFQLPRCELKTSASRSDCDVLFISTDNKGKAQPPKGPYSKSLEILTKNSIFSGKNGQLHYAALAGKNGSLHSAFVGVGTNDATPLSYEKLRLAGGQLRTRIIQDKVKTLSLHASSLSIEQVHAFLEGFIMASYGYDKYHSLQPKERSEKYYGPEKITILTNTKSKETKKALEEVIKNIIATGEVMNIARDWSNEPSNTGNATWFAEESKKLAKEFGLKCTVLGRTEAKKENMNLFLAVGQGSENEGKVVVLEYNPPKTNDNVKTIALVGKGVTFDSGGISIKPSAKMEDMKHDMTGAATMMASIVLAAKLKLPKRVIAVLAFTENMPDGKAINPGSVIKSRSGKTVEIINTDAEGRLVLADVLDYAQDFKPDVLLNAATLTGAVAVALGKHACGLMGNDQAVMNDLLKIGEENYERFWQLPLFDEYFEDMKTPYADMKNSCNDPYGGTIRGGIFLKQFIRKGTRWAHIDLATVAYQMGHLSYCPKFGASGMVIRSVAQFIERFE